MLSFISSVPSLFVLSIMWIYIRINNKSYCLMLSTFIRLFLRLLLCSLSLSFIADDYKGKDFPEDITIDFNLFLLFLDIFFVLCLLFVCCLKASSTCTSFLVGRKFNVFLGNSLSVI